ncbi:3',5'-cyclic AMP phosphodiesterase CpdA [Ruminiclostridium sufflavum DSM 19573]|uniref:3',5'-cyclic AMP phosphodiesterase CpdA n=1 Tax=Ruminiclostridium sufflavum DSM 19573 TaxID=1121337 RepID=A0A318Y2J0_9FIRM|nr:metallophosphoesterase [Ruminiclostridium sufflavum]PYG85726.1 3',5'-cyclic AMP phosphodiesterase CpdA [Ruminiclostridium sufflavum DSM 19573]
MVRIALISDIHFGLYSRTTEFSVPGEPIQDENTGAVSLKNSLISILKEANAQYLCIAGDLTSIGSPQEFAFCEDTVTSIAQEAGISKDNVIFGLGNHDIDWKISELYTSYKDYSSDFPHELVKDKYRRIAASASLINTSSALKFNRNGPAPCSGIIENDDFIMFILNSGWCCTQDQAVSHGKLNVDQLNWFEESVKLYRTDKRWKIVLMHHHPYAYSYPTPIFDISMLEESGHFLDIAGKNGIHLVLHGHRHHPRAETTQKNEWINPITFVCAGSLTVNSKHRSNGDIPNTLHIIELTDDVGVLKLLNYQYSPAQGWLPIKNNCPETPLDSEMMLGKLFSEDEIKQSIGNLKADTPLSWKNLDESLRFCGIDDLNRRIDEILSSTHKMIGLFPKDVVLIKNGGAL